MLSEFVLAGGLLRVRFFAAGGRYAHVIELTSDDRAWPLLESVEGSPDALWPVSPALQSCNIEKLSTDRRVALLVGMAGRSHWSLAAEVPTSANRERLTFDVACRVSTLPDYLGNRYRLGSAVRWEAETCLLRTPLGIAHVRPDHAVAEVRPSRSANEIEIVPRHFDRPLPATIRWKFAIEVPIAGQ